MCSDACDTMPKMIYDFEKLFYYTITLVAANLKTSPVFVFKKALPETASINLKQSHIRVIRRLEVPIISESVANYLY